MDGGGRAVTTSYLNILQDPTPQPVDEGRRGGGKLESIHLLPKFEVRTFLSPNVTDPTLLAWIPTLSPILMAALAILRSKPS